MKKLPFILQIALLCVSILLLSVITFKLFTLKNTKNQISTTNTAEYQHEETITNPEVALKLLKEGNKRYTENKPLKKKISEDTRKNLASNGQKPFAIVLTCSDSRVSPELMFDQGIGDLFVIRDAGNIVKDVELGSIEYGAEHLKSPLIVVLSHEKCGAVKATVDGGEFEGGIKSIVDEILPSFEKVKATETNKELLYEKCTDENKLHSLNKINNDTIIKHLTEEHKVKTISAKYMLTTGQVIFDEKDSKE